SLWACRAHSCMWSSDHDAGELCRLLESLSMGRRASGLRSANILLVLNGEREAYFIDLVV
ncbi:hypothetical protein M3583_26185, partial [Bacillus subtilis]|nr:hypothetical protein [Bacillus subtilis]